jgi:hypothetical protein
MSSFSKLVNYIGKERKEMKNNPGKKLVYAIFGLLLYFTGCTDDQTTAPSTQNIVPPLAKLSDIQAKVFINCTDANCHSAATHQANLVLENGQAFSNLVNVQSTLFPQFKRVEPGSGGNSLLIKILKGEVSPRMPFNRTPLSNDVIDSIEVWIESGAPNN